MIYIYILFLIYIYIYIHIIFDIYIYIYILFLIYNITKGSSRGATLSFTLRSKGEGGQPRYLIIQEIASHFSTPPNVTYFVLRVYTMLSCMLTCTQNSFYLMRTPHGSRLACKTASTKECSSHFLSAGVSLGFQGSLNTGKATSKW